MTTLAQRLVQHPVWGRDGFGWQKGMVSTAGNVFAGWREIPPDYVDDFEPEELKIREVGNLRIASTMYWLSDDEGDEHSLCGIFPDIEHPATKGRLLDQCQRMAKALATHPWQLPTPILLSADTWCVAIHAHCRPRYAPTEGAAITKAWLWLADALTVVEAG